jgi:hypothetical protein
MVQFLALVGGKCGVDIAFGRFRSPAGMAVIVCPLGVAVSKVIDTVFFFSSTTHCWSNSAGY